MLVGTVQTESMVGIKWRMVVQGGVGRVAAVST